MSRGGGGSAIVGGVSGTVSAARIGIAEKRKLDEARRSFWDEAISELKRFKDLAGFADEARIESLIGKIERDRSDAASGVVRFSADEYQRMKSNFNFAVESLRESFEERDEVLRKFNALRAANQAPRVYEAVEGETMGAFHRGHVAAAKVAVLGRGRIGKSMSGSVIAHDGSKIEKSEMTYDARVARMNVSRDLKDIESIIETGMPLTEEQREEYDVEPQGINASRVERGVDGLLSSAGRYGRWVASTSNPGDSSKYRSFLESKNKHLRDLTREVSNFGGFATRAMDILESQFEENGYLNEEGAGLICDILKEVRDADEQGITDEILDEFNHINKAAIKKAQDHVDNEDSMSTVRIIQALLVISVIVGFPLLAPIVGAFAGSILGGGLVAGTPALMTHSAWGPLGSLADVLFFDDFVGIVLRDTPAFSQAFGLIDYALLSGPGQVIGGGVTSLLGAPITPIAGAALFALYAKGRKGYNESSDAVNKAFENFEKEMDDLVKKYSGADTMKGGKNPLEDDGFRRGFLERKNNFVKDSDKIEALADFVNAVNKHCQELDENVLPQILSPELVRLLRENGMEGSDSVSDDAKVKKVVAKLFYEAKEDPQKQAFLDRLNRGFGLFSYAAETSPELDMESVMENMLGIIDLGEDIGAKATMGMEIFDAKSVISRAKENGVGVDCDLSDSDFSGKSGPEVAQMVGKLKAEAGKAEAKSLDKEDGLMKKTLEGEFNKGLLKGFHNRPGVSPQTPNVKKLLNMGPATTRV